ncbi:MAG: hypothetical protein ACRD2G_08215, partial [Terriglobia bacterium]
SLNRYAYALNNPTTLTDPLGLDSMPYQPPTVVNVYGSSPTDFQILPCSYEAIAEAACYGGWSPAPPGWYEGSTSGGTSTPHPAPKPTPPSSFTLGLRLPNQTFNQCMTQNATNYSAGGAVDLILGFNNVFSNSYLQVATGNTFTSLYAGVFGGLGSSAAGAGASVTPDLLNTAMGSPLSYGRRTADIMALNLEGKGGLPLALSPVPEIGELKSVFGSASNAFNLGLDAAEKGAVDAGLFGAEVIGCSISQ